MFSIFRIYRSIIPCAQVVQVHPQLVAGEVLIRDMPRLVVPHFQCCRARARRWCR